MVISGIDPLVAMESSQRQMKILAENLYRSSNVGIGFALSLDKLIKQLSEG